MDRLIWHVGCPYQGMLTDQGKAAIFKIEHSIYSNNKSNMYVEIRNVPQHVSVLSKNKIFSKTRDKLGSTT